MKLLAMLTAAALSTFYATAPAQTPTAPAAPATQAAENLAELPHWPIGFLLPENVGAPKPARGGKINGDIMVWIPPEAKKIRAMMLVPNNSDSKETVQHPPLRAVAAKHGMAIVFMRRYNTGIEHHKENPPDLTRMPALMELLVEKTGMPEFRHAPWVTFGKSSRGEFPFHAAWFFPTKVIASMTYHGETPVWPPPNSECLKESILQVNANGETEWGGTWYAHVRPSLLNYRAKGKWLTHLAVARGIGHGDYPLNDEDFATTGRMPRVRVWDYLTVFLDKALAARLPKDGYPTTGPLKLNQVDEASGYLIDPFAVEELFQVPHLPLVEGADGLYKVGGAEEPPVSGYAKVAPAKNVPEAPVVPLELEKSPSDWLITESLKFAMKADPILDVGPLRTLMPKVGDEVTIDGKTITFRPIQPKYVAKGGGLAMNTGLKPKNSNITLLAFTVLDVREKKTVRVAAGYSAATRIQFVLNGVPIKNRQVLELEPGKYPLLLVLRMAADWGRITPHFVEATAEHVALAKQMQAEADKAAEDLAKRKASGVKKVLIRKASDVPAEERKKMLWVADREQAEAWFKLHAIHGQVFEAK